MCKGRKDMKKRVLCLVLAAMLVCSTGGNVFATSSINKVQKEQTETKNKLNEINKSIDAIESKKAEVQAELSNLNTELVDTLLTLEVLEADLERKQEEIAEAQAEYEEYKALEEKQYHAMKQRIKYMYETGDTDYIVLLLEAKSITDLINRADFVQQVSDYDDEKLTEYQETKEKVAETKAVLEEEEAELEEVQEAQQQYKASLDSKIASAKAKQAGFETELANAQKKAKEYQKTIKEQTATIQKLQKEEEEKRKKEQAAANAGTTGNSTTTGTSGTTSTSGSTSSSVPTASGSGTGASIASYALQFVGNPYVSGGTSLTNGADCSGFTQSVFKHFGISIPRTSGAQAGGGKSVSLSEIQAGDIIYYGGHVAIYIGNGQIVHASTQKTGIKVSSYLYRTPISVRRYW